ncbi:hypothetical protein ES703_41750 [subsurface metagenome]
MFNKKILILSVVVLVFSSGGYLIYQNFQETIPKETFSETKLDEEVKIQADRDTYAPELSSIVGIGLTPIYTLDRHLETVKFHWHTNYGHFVSWELRRNFFYAGNVRIYCHSLAKSQKQKRS